MTRRTYGGARVYFGTPEGRPPLLLRGRETPPHRAATPTARIGHAPTPAGAGALLRIGLVPRVNWEGVGVFPTTTTPGPAGSRCNLGGGRGWGGEFSAPHPIRVSVQPGVSRFVVGAGPPLRGNRGGGAAMHPAPPGATHPRPHIHRVPVQPGKGEEGGSVPFPPSPCGIWVLVRFLGGVPSDPPPTLPTTPLGCASSVRGPGAKRGCRGAVKGGAASCKQLEGRRVAPGGGPGAPSAECWGPRVQGLGGVGVARRCTSAGDLMQQCQRHKGLVHQGWGGVLVLCWWGTGSLAYGYQGHEGVVHGF